MKLFWATQVYSMLLKDMWVLRRNLKKKKIRRRKRKNREKGTEKGDARVKVKNYPDSKGVSINVLY